MELMGIKMWIWVWQTLIRVGVEKRGPNV